VSRLLHPQVGLHATGTSGGRRSRRETGGNVLLALPRGIQRKRGDSKWRIVLDASSHERGVPSINDALEMGSKLLPQLFAILLCSRLNPVPIIGDIHQAILQLQLDPKDRHLTTFFWYRVTRDVEENYNTTDKVIFYRFTRLPFGLTCSPFLLSASVRDLPPYSIAFPRRQLFLIAVPLWTILWRIRAKI
jgi:hypothetical protein